MRRILLAVFAAAGLSPIALPPGAARASDPTGREIRFSLEGTYTPLTARPECFFFVLAACELRWSGAGRVAGDIDGRLEYSRRTSRVPPFPSADGVRGLSSYDVDDRLLGRLAGCGEGILELQGEGWWTGIDPARAGFRSVERLFAMGRSDGFRDFMAMFEARVSMGLDGSLRAQYVGRVHCPADAVGAEPPRRQALRAGRRCTRRKQRMYRRHGFVCRKRGDGRHRLARAGSRP